MLISAPYNVAVIFLHPACNMACTFCITEDNFDAITEQQAFELLQTLKQEGFTNVVFGGGEPFEWHGDLTALTKEAKRLGFTVQVGTNAVALPENFASIESIDRFVLPLESVESNVHNAMRLYKNRHHQVITDALEKLRASRKSVTISTIITKVNKDSVGPLAAYLKKLNEPYRFVHAWHLYKFLPLGRGGSNNAANLMITSEEYSAACEKAKSTGLPFPVYRRRDMYRSKTVDFFWSEHGELQRASVNHKSDPVAKMTVPYADGEDGAVK